MKEEPQKPYVYQSFPPQEDGKYYAVGGLHRLGLGFDFEIKGITKDCAEFVVRALNDNPESAATFAKEFKKSLDEGNVFSSCGCRFESSDSNSVLLCDVCSGLPCHSCTPHHLNDETKE